MAKKRGKRESYGTGKTVKEIISGVSRNIGRMKESTLRSAVTRLSSAMNKRLDRAEKAGVDSPAVKSARESGGRFSGKGKTLEGLKAEFIRIKNFFQNPTSTQEGWKKVQKEATEEAIKKGVLKGKRGGGVGPLPPPPKEPPKERGDEWELGPVPPEEPTWTPPEGWTWNEETRSWEHPQYGSGWLPYEEEGGGLIDPITGQIVGNTARTRHDYDVTEDNKVWGEGTETGKLWQMVDSIAAMDPRFTKRDDSDPKSDPRMQLFNAIDDAWVENPALSFEQARDLVAGRLDEIYEQAASHFMNAHSMGFSTFFSDDDDW